MDDNELKKEFGAAVSEFEGLRDSILLIGSYVKQYYQAKGSTAKLYARGKLASMKDQKEFKRVLLLSQLLREITRKVSYETGLPVEMTDKIRRMTAAICDAFKVQKLEDITTSINMIEKENLRLLSKGKISIEPVDDTINTIKSSLRELVNEVKKIAIADIIEKIARLSFEINDSLEAVRQSKISDLTPANAVTILRFTKDHIIQVNNIVNICLQNQSTDELARAGTSAGSIEKMRGVIIASWNNLVDEIRISLESSVKADITPERRKEMNIYGKDFTKLPFSAKFISLSH